jgi:hypothetical protein
VSSGAAATTPSAAGTVQPRGPACPALIQCRERYTWRNWAAAIWESPIVLTYRVSGPNARFISS